MAGKWSETGKFCFIQSPLSQTSPVPSRGELMANNKKRIEAHFMEEARRACAVFPAGELKPHEKPDFLLLTDRGKLGIEVTEICREDPRAEAGRLSKIPDKAKELYSRYPQAEPVDVSVAFGRAEEVASIASKVLTKSLADFVYAHRTEKTGFKRDLPQGFLYIGILRPRDQPHWHAGRAFHTTIARHRR
ncbi:MAG TPA: hypothetical protein VMT20_01955 [Terriglobia bacterium]|nr:hypothetical protein [Terriglobia bacterium]